MHTAGLLEKSPAEGDLYAPRPRDQHIPPTSLPLNAQDILDISTLQPGRNLA